MVQYYVCFYFNIQNISILLTIFQQFCQWLEIILQHQINFDKKRYLLHNIRNLEWSHVSKFDNGKEFLNTYILFVSINIYMVVELPIVTLDADLKQTIPKMSTNLIILKLLEMFPGLEVGNFDPYQFMFCLKFSH